MLFWLLCNKDMVKTYMVLGFARLAKRGESKLMRFSTLNYTEKILSTLVHLLFFTKLAITMRKTFFLKGIVTKPIFAMFCVFNIMI